MKLIFLMLLLLLSFIAKAQLASGNELLSAFSSGDKMVKTALDSSVCIIKQEYSLVNRGRAYGWRNKPYFGYAISVGVITNTGIKTDRKIMFPWSTDKNYDNFRGVDTLKPTLTKAYFKRFADKTYNEFKDARTDTSGNRQLVSYKTPDSLMNINAAIMLKESSGWVDVISIKKNSTLSDTAQFTSSVYKTSLYYKDSVQVAYIKNFEDKGNNIGGVYYTFSISKRKIEFEAAGIVKKNSNGWYVEFFTNTDQRTQIKKEEKLTPIGKQERTPKNDSQKISK